MELSAQAHVLPLCSVTAQWSGIKHLASLVEILSNISLKGWAMEGHGLMHKIMWAPHPKFQHVVPPPSLPEKILSQFVLEMIYDSALLATVPSDSEVY